MLSSYYPGGKPSALEICGNGKFFAVYLDQHMLLDSPEFSPQGVRPGGHQGPEDGAAPSERAGVLSPERVCSEASAPSQ
jgi:hypothetical protein